MRLRDHQIEALAAIETAAAAGEQRMTVVSACGTGKTLIAQQAAQRLAPQGAVLVLMPTKALVTQTARRWRETGHPGLALGVCSLRQTESGLAPGEALMTRGARAIARAMRVGGPVTVFATYDSLHHIKEAHDQHGLAPWDLVIADEAHRTCSAFGDGWGTIHDDAAIPAKIRLYMTATPRVWDTPAPDELTPFMERIPLATMDHREIFGPTVFELGMAKAIERGILADYQVVMPIVDDADLHAILAERRPNTTAHHNGLRNGAMQVAVLRAIAEHGLRRVLLFHNRIAWAKAFAASLPQTALEVGEELRIENLWAQAIHSKQSGEWRRDLLEDFADPDRECAVLSNVRVLNEGVDMPDVDAVIFVDPRYSVIDAVQGIGRGLRQPPGAQKKTTLVIPVYLRRGADTTNLLEDSAFANLITLLQALRSHDESFMDRIALPARTRPRNPAAAERAHYYARPERAAQLARALGLELTLPAVGTWEQAHAAATAYRARFGHLDVPGDYIDEDGFALGECLANLRLRHLLDRLPDEHEQALDALGMLWAAPEQTFDVMLERARAWAAEHGHLSAPVKEHVGGHRIGAWLATLRRKAASGQLPDAHREALDAIDPYWNAPWPRDWQRQYVRAQALVRASRWRLDMHDDTGTSDQDRSTVNWIHRQRLNFFHLHEQQQDLLLQLRIPPLPDGVFHDSSIDPERHAFYVGLGYLAVFLAREGHANVPRHHREQQGRTGDGRRSAPYALGEWVHQCRKHPERLTEEQRHALEALRMVWDPKLGRRKRPKPPPGP
ncbi:Helicase associated domain protein [Streptomyces ferrugineus]|uniref:Helicase associated domain protein n=1 Tax=Streptomyces ferrugineus TaxID=1413221 RepID=A0A7M2SCM7_9ACTN|nr:DEAD/DEAH box helicase [Streptomyces ferrugineus]QOV33238.1 Helicase associated domain protein [Streptomyces ferrugineus]